METLESENIILALTIGVTLFIILVIFVIILIILRFKDREFKYQTNFKISQQQTEIRTINARLNGAEQERIRVAQVLHDGIASQLTAADFQLASMRTTADDRKVESIDRSIELLRATSKQVRDLSHELVPPVLLKLGLGPAIEDLCYKYSSDHMSFSMMINDEVRFRGVNLNRENSFTLYLITQELLQNILKHSDATEVSIHVMQDEYQWSIDLVDNSSISIVTNSNEDQSLGLISLRTRIESIGGSFNRIYNSTDNKNIQRIEIPYK